MTLDGSKVRKYLDENEKSREWLAVQLGCSIRTVDYLLAGKIPRGSEKLLLLAALMGLQTEDLVSQKAKRTA